MHDQRERSPSESLFWPVVWAVGLHVIMFAMLFVSFAFAPDLPPAKPVVQATLYKLQSQSQATTQTNQKIAGETKKTTAPVYETEQLEQKKAEQEKVAAKAAEQKKAQEVQKAQEAKKAEADKKAAEQKKLADVAKKKAADEAAKKKAAEDAKKKAAEEAKKKAAAEAAKKKKADDAKKKAAEAAQRKAVEDKKAAALAELLSEDVGRQQAIADTVGDEVAGSLDDLIVMLVSQQWRRPPSARNGMSVEVLIEMLPDGTITNASVTRSSGDSPFDNSAVQAVRNVGRIAEMQQLDRATFDRLYRQRRAVFKPEDLGL
ncbi:Cell division and transport-associated protein TolA [Pseudomonas peli]|jgi:colicin import membrane protein|uniref:Cell division and transport-associated protein TolA n=1 Tax=Pseudomonas peli TaxID=592361 RepID=A0AB37Z8B6_9PSED|nr:MULTISPECIES: cell envelope integrity protein TolA [Pseudomonas]MDR7024726.1 colicin import membrane protein [Pseudomonas peli]NMZ70062.1 cell envelope integrity protein TolA [Pseudomonas peli]SCW65056.1 Cell division and transport-associated protein TolA [Pseudomonas peli]|tara:strand:- start:1481 stop:2431 length:951 start_codon:yes stop_codon:yes gene_type:complete